MSDYMFMLESHLSADQSRVLAAIQTAAAEAGLNLFLTGGAMRDMLGGFPIRDLNFAVEGSPLKLVKGLAETPGATLVKTDEHRKTGELGFPGGVRVEIGMARSERFSRPGARPQVTPATIHEDLIRRDFTINAIALSLNRGSRGLLLDPTNGQADLERKELRAISNFGLYDDPVRLLRLIRLKVRLGFAVNERTAQQYRNAREAEVETRIPAAQRLEELRRMAEEPNPVDLMKAMGDEGLLKLFSPALEGAKLNTAGFAKLQKAKQLIPFGVDFRLENFGLFLFLLTEKLSPREKAAMAEATGMTKADLDLFQKLESRAKRLEAEVKSPKLHRASQIYSLLSKAQGDVVLFLYIRSPHRLVQDRIRNFFQKYLLVANEVTERDVIAQGLEPGTAKFAKKREQMIAARLDGRVKKPAPPPDPPPVVEMKPGRGMRRTQLSH